MLIFLNSSDPFGLCDKPGEPQCQGILQNLGQFFSNLGAGSDCALNGNCGHTAPGSLGDAVGKLVGFVAFMGRMGNTGDGSEYLDPQIESQGGDRAGSWGNPETLEDHYLRHGSDFGATSAEDYASRAGRFLREGRANGLPTKVDADGVIRMYDPQTNTFGSYNSDGTTRTFFKPTRGAAYWADQKGQPPDGGI